jgi:hypothetical protein
LATAAHANREAPQRSFATSRRLSAFVGIAIAVFKKRQSTVKGSPHRAWERFRIRLKLLLRLRFFNDCNAFFEVIERAQPANFIRDDNFVGLYRCLHVFRDQLLDFHLTVTTSGDFAISFNARHFSNLLRNGILWYGTIYERTQEIGQRSFLWQVLQRTRMPTNLLHFGHRFALRANFNLVRGRKTMPTPSILPSEIDGTELFRKSETAVKRELQTTSAIWFEN